jgi:hypothetical protein
LTRVRSGTDTGAYAEEMLKWARDGDMSVLEQAPTVVRAFRH